MRRDSVLGTLTVAAVLCVVCSVLVSAAAVGLRNRQQANKSRYEKKNILIAAGLYHEGASIDELFKNIETRIIDLETGERVPEDVIDPETFDQRKAAKDPKMSVEISPEKDIAGIKRREKFAKVYLVRDEDGRISKVVLPVYGKGLWSTLYGFIALEPDLNTVAGLTFYEHAETPGLGGEIENETWKAKWEGKLLKDGTGQVAIEVIKGAVDPSHPRAAHQIDGLSGATITSRGVSNLIRYWCGDVFAPFLEKLKQEIAAEGASNG